MAISANGGPWTNTGSALKTLAVVPVTAGDILVLSFNGAATAFSSSVSGGGVTTWAQAAGYLDTGLGVSVEIWWGVVTSTGSSTITVTNSTATGFNRLHAREWTGSASWAVLAASPSPPTSGGSTSATGTTVNYPSLTGSGLYVGHSDEPFGNMTGGSTSGFTYDNNNGHQEVAWANAAVNAAPTSTTDNAGGYEICAALFGAAAGGAVSQPPPPLIPPGFQSPAAFTAFMPVPQGGTLVAGADTGTGADTGSVAVAVSDADTGSAADSGTVAVAVSDADTGTGADTGSVAVAVSDADTGTGADTGSVLTPLGQPPPPLIPPGFQSPAAFTAFMPVPQGGALVTDSDTGTGADTGSVAVAVSDADTAAGADTGSVAVAVSDADTGTGADTGSVAVAVSDADTGSAADSGTVVTAVPQPPPPLIPPGFQSPAAFTAFMPVPQGGALAAGSDTGSATDTGSVAVAVSDADTGTGADTGSVAVAVSGADTGTGADTGSVAVAVSDADTGTGADAATVLVPAAPAPPLLIPPGFISPMAFAALRNRPAATPGTPRGHSAEFLVFFP